MAPKKDSPLNGALQQLQEAQTCSEYNACLSDIKAALSDLCSATKASKSSLASLKKLSAKWAPSLIEILKVALTQLSEGVVDSTSAQALASIYEQGITGLEAFRNCLSGRPIELELHRHAVVGKLIAHQHYSLAGEHACRLLAALSRQLTCNEDSLQESRAHCALPCDIPAPRSDADHDTAQLVVVTATNIVLCSLHAQEESLGDLLSALPALVEQLQPWLRKLPESEQLRQQEHLSKYLSKAALLGNASLLSDAKAHHGTVSLELGTWALRAATASHVPKRTSQVYAWLAEELPQEACQALLSSVLDGLEEAAAEDDAAVWAAAEAVWVVETATAAARKTGGAAHVVGLLLSALQRDGHAYMWLHAFQAAALAAEAADKGSMEEEALGTCLHTAACRLMRLLKDLSSTDSSYQALLSALLQSLHALQKAVAPLQTGLPLSVWLAAVEGLQLAPLVLRALEGTDDEQQAGQVPSKARARRHEQAGACLATAASARAMQALHAAAEARQNSGSMACTSGRADSSMLAGDCGLAAPAGSRGAHTGSWGSVQQLTEEAIEHLESLLHAEELHCGVRLACLAGLAPATAELRFLAALQGQHKLQASLDRLCADSWRQQPSPANLQSALRDCQLSQMLCPQVTASVSSLSGQLGSGQTGQQLRLLAADAALEPVQDHWRALHRGLLHLLAATQLQREGDLTQALSEAAEALRHSGAALQSSGAFANHFSGGSAPGTWQVTWQYLACLLRNGELYEQLGAWEDALLAFKEGLLMAQSIEAQALEAIFSVSQADVYAKQHSFDRAAALLEAAKPPLVCSSCMQLCIAARASAVRATMHGLQGDHQGARQQCQAGIQLASRALRHLLLSVPEAVQSSQDLARKCSKQASSSKHAASADSSRSNSTAARRMSEEQESDDSSAPQSAWHVRSLLAQLHFSLAELLREAGDREGAGSCLQAARDACCDPAPGAGDASEAFPIQTASVLYLEAALQLEQQDFDTNAGGKASNLWCLQAAVNQPASYICSARTQIPAGRNSQKWRRKQSSVRASDESSAGAEPTAALALCQLLTAWKLGKAMPSLSRRIAGALAQLLGRMGLPHAAALFVHASLGAAVTAQYAAILQSRLAAQQRQAARAARAARAAQPPGAADPADAAREAELCGQLLNALQPETFSADTWEAAAAGQELNLALLEAEARAHLEKQLSGNPDGTPVVTLSMLPGCPDQWLLTRCVRGQTPHLVQVEAAGENADEELAALLEESGASMHTQKESKADKAAWWRTRIALDARLQHLCAALQKRLGPWMSMLPGSPAGLSGHSAAALMTSAQACIREAAKGHVSELSPAALDILATLVHGCDCLTDADLAAGITELLSAAGYTVETTEGQSIASQMRSIACEAMGAKHSAAGAALQDISNRQQAAAEAPKAPSSTLKAERRALHSLSTASEEAQSCLRSAPGVAWANARMQQSPSECDGAASSRSVHIRQPEDSAAHHSAQQLMSVAEEEADCILRATTRRAAHASSGTQAFSKPASARGKQARRGGTPSTGAAAESGPPSENRSPDNAMSDADTEASRDRALTSCADSPPHADLAYSAACSTPGPSRRTKMLQDDVEVADADIDCAATPMLPMTARRKGRFAAMQSLEAPATALRPARKEGIPEPSLAFRLGAAALPPKTPHAPVRKEAGRRKVAFAEELPTTAPAGSQSSVRRGRKPRATPGAKPATSEARTEADQSLHSRTPFKLHRAPLEELDMSVGSLGTRLRAMSLGAESGQQAPDKSDGKLEKAADAPMQRGPVLVILDERLQSLPWESLPALRSQRVYRSPSLACACATALRNQSTAPGSGDSAAAAESRAVDARDAVYMLNPSGDLPHTQDTFQDFFRQQTGWQGSVGAPGLAGAALSEALRQRSLFVYCGHGAGQQHLPGRALRRQRACAASLLMGCSSGRLARSGQHYEPSGPILAYLLAGCPVAVGNLWDVTDRDIDRFAKTLLEKWLSEGPGEGGMQEAQAEQDSRDRVHGSERLLCVSRSVSDSRSVCRLPHLIGAAPVCYGVPTSVLLK